MKKESEIIDDEELKRFFLNEAMLLCPSALGDVLEREKLQILYNTLQKIVKLLGVLNHCNLEMHLRGNIPCIRVLFYRKRRGKEKKT